MDKRQAKISVVMSTYRESLEFVETAIESILAQTIPVHEFIIYVDDQTNNTVVDYLRGLEGSNQVISLYINATPKGLAACRNAGIDKATGEYVALMDSDDIAAPNRFELQLGYLLDHEKDIVFSHVTYIDYKQNELGSFEPTLVDQTEDIFKKHIFAHPTGFAKREVFDAGRYDESFMRAQDVDLWIRLIDKGVRFGIVPTSLLLYRVHRNQSPEARLERQEKYANYGYKIAQKHHASKKKNPAFVRFYLKWMLFHFFYTFTPKIVLLTLMKIRDSLRGSSRQNLA